MEHRLSKRVQGELGLLIYKRGMPVAFGQIKDASLRGLFITTDYDDIQVNQTIEMEFCLPDRQENGFRKLKAQVARKVHSGLGVDFETVENNSVAIVSLVQWLERHHVQRQQLSVRRD